MYPLINMAHPIFIQSMLEDSCQAAQACRVWVTAQHPRGQQASETNVWMKELAPEQEIIKLLKSGKMSWSEFEAYYHARLRTPTAQDDIRALACLSQQRPLILACNCPEATECCLPALVRAIQECRDKKDFKLSLENLGIGKKFQ
jgi:uncharacterized protein YeaO (DUF488 family)